VIELGAKTQPRQGDCASAAQSYLTSGRRGSDRTTAQKVWRRAMIACGDLSAAKKQGGRGVTSCLAKPLKAESRSGDAVWKITQICGKSKDPGDLETSPGPATLINKRTKNE